MIRIIFVSLLLSFTPLICYANPKDDALKVLEEWSVAFAQADVDGIINLYSKDALFFGTGSKAVVTRTDGIRTYFERALLNDRPRTATINSYSSIELTDSIILVSGLDTITGMRNGIQTVSKGRVTIVIAKKDDEWKIVQFHRSILPE